VGAASPAITELAAWARYRRGRVALRRDVEHLVSLLDRAFPGLSGCLHLVMATRVGRLVVADFREPGQLARLGVARFRRYAAKRGLRVTTEVAERLVAAAREALPAADAPVAREAIGRDLALLAEIDRQLAHIADEPARVLPATPFDVLTTPPGVGYHPRRRVRRRARRPEPLADRDPGLPGIWVDPGSSRIGWTPGGRRDLQGGLGPGAVGVARARPGFAASTTVPRVRTRRAWSIAASTRW
jgi:hypothetical protein